MTKRNLQKTSDKQDKKIKRLYALIWFLACPLVYVIALIILKFTQINIVYWTLLVIPVLLAIYNVRQVPPVAVKAEDTTLPLPEGIDETTNPEPEAQEPDNCELEGVTRTQRVKLLALALKAPVIIAAPLLITVVAALFIK